jgi:hypothetical protein
MWMAIVILIGLAALMIEGQLQAIVFLLVETLYHGEVRSNQWCQSQRLKLNIAISQGLSEMWVRNLLSKLKVLRKGPLNVWCDNKSAICMASSPVQHDRTKHVEIDHFFIKEKLDEGIIRINHKFRRTNSCCLTKGLGVKRV